MSIVACPTCGHPLREVDKKEINKKLDGVRDEDTAVWFCKKCKAYIYAEDFLYSTEEE